MIKVAEFKSDNLFVGNCGACFHSTWRSRGVEFDTCPSVSPIGNDVSCGRWTAPEFYTGEFMKYGVNEGSLDTFVTAPGSEYIPYVPPAEQDKVRRFIRSAISDFNLPYVFRLQRSCCTTLSALYKLDTTTRFLVLNHTQPGFSGRNAVVAVTTDPLWTGVSSGCSLGFGMQIQWSPVLLRAVTYLPIVLIFYNSTNWIRSDTPVSQGWSINWVFNDPLASNIPAFSAQFYRSPTSYDLTGYHIQLVVSPTSPLPSNSWTPSVIRVENMPSVFSMTPSS